MSGRLSRLGCGRPAHERLLPLAHGAPEPWALGPFPEPWALDPFPEPWALGPFPEPWALDPFAEPWVLDPLLQAGRFPPNGVQALQHGQVLSLPFKHGERFKELVLDDVLRRSSQQYTLSQAERRVLLSACEGCAFMTYSLREYRASLLSHKAGGGSSSASTSSGYNSGTSTSSGTSSGTSGASISDYSNRLEKFLSLEITYGKLMAEVCRARRADQPFLWVKGHLSHYCTSQAGLNPAKSLVPYVPRCVP